jgi:hypothetical protein
MKYKITYDFNSNSLKDPNDLYIYDFGYIKVFIYNSDINVYRIIEKKEYYEIIEEFDGILPLDLISLEKYKCDYKNNNYITENFTIVFNNYLDTKAPIFEPIVKSSQPLAPKHLAPQPLLPKPFRPPVQQHCYQQNLQKNNTNKKISSIHKDYSKQNLMKEPLVENFQQIPSNSWISLDQILQVPQQQKIQHSQQLKQGFFSKKHHQNFSNVRQHPKQSLKGHQLSTHQNDPLHVSN